MVEQLTPAQLVEVVRADRRRRWQQGERVLVEAYLQRHPRLQAQTECVLDLVYQEVLLREELGEVPQLAEYLGRFPQLAGQLQPLFEVHRAVADGQLFQPISTGITGPATPPEDTGPAAPPPTIAGYELLGRLGRGGMGVVYQALDRRLNRLVALKMILAGSHADTEDSARFRAEAQAQARLQHPNIVQIYEVGEADGWPYFALEYVDGGSLEQGMAGQPQPARVAAQLVETLARAMHHAHERGLVHRDLKPANILLSRVEDRGWRIKDRADNGDPPSSILDSRFSIPKITDFGLAKRLDGEAGRTQSGAVVGTPSYMAPEQAGGSRQAVGPAADV
jgi:serine/threonine protein kinase